MRTLSTACFALAVTLAPLCAFADYPASSEVTCSVSVRPYLPGEGGARNFLEPGRYQLRVRSGDVSAQPAQSGWMLQGGTSAVEIEYDVIDSTDGSVLLHDRASLECGARESNALLAPPPVALATALPPGASSGIVQHTTATNSRPKDADDVLAVELLRSEFGIFAPSLANANFAGSFRREGHTLEESFTRTGADLGYRRPMMFTFDMEPFNVAFRPHLMGGVFLGFGSGGADATATGAPAGVSIAPAAWMVRGGVTAGTMWGFGPAELRVSLRAGFQTYSIGAPNTTRTCTDTSRNSSGMTLTSSYPCAGSFTTASVLLEPRASLGFAVTRHTRLGIYGGADILPDVSFEGGAFLSLETRAFHRLTALFADRDRPGA